MSFTVSEESQVWKSHVIKPASLAGFWARSCTYLLTLETGGQFHGNQLLVVAVVVVVVIQI